MVAAAPLKGFVMGSTMGFLLMLHHGDVCVRALGDTCVSPGPWAAGVGVPSFVPRGGWVCFGGLSRVGECW